MAKQGSEEWMKLTQDDLLLMSALEKISGVTPKDCIVNNNSIAYLVKEHDVGRAIGKNAQSVKELEKRLGKKIEIYGYGEKPEEMIAKALKVKFASATTKGGKIFIMLDGMEKKKLFGNMGRMRTIKEFVERNYGLEAVVL